MKPRPPQSKTHFVMVCPKCEADNNFQRRDCERITLENLTCLHCGKETAAFHWNNRLMKEPRLHDQNPARGPIEQNTRPTWAHESGGPWVQGLTADGMKCWV